MGASNFLARGLGDGRWQRTLARRKTALQTSLCSRAPAHRLPLGIFQRCSSGRIILTIAVSYQFRVWEDQAETMPDANSLALNTSRVSPRAISASHRAAWGRKSRQHVRGGGRGAESGEAVLGGQGQRGCAASGAQGVIGLPASKRACLPHSTKRKGLFRNMPSGAGLNHTFL